MEFVDRDNVDVSIGDILYYDEGDGGAKGIHEVVERNSIVYGKTHLFDGLDGIWTLSDKDDVVELKYYTGYLSNNNKLVAAKVIGNVVDNPEMLYLDWANKNKPLT